MYCVPKTPHNSQDELGIVCPQLRGVTLAELSEDHGIVFEQGDIVTLAGLALAARGVMPEQGAQFELEGYRLTIDEVSGFKITRIRLDRL